MFEGTAFSNLSFGMSTLNVMNQMQFDMMGVGNHEYSWGLDSILKFFDNDDTNGEANFPLINGNIYTDSKRYGEDILDDNILPYTIVEKGDFKIGILSYIGDIASSISKSYLETYKIQADETYFRTQIKNDALKLKEAGADFIVFNIHDGDSKSIFNFQTNRIVSELTDSNGNYLIDAIINGHTHSKQSGIYNRGKSKVPMVQGGCYCDTFGEMTLVINKQTKKVIDATSNVIYTDSISKYDKEKNVQKVIEEEYNKIIDTVEKTYCYNANEISRQALGNLMAKEIRKATSADISIINTGGIRTVLEQGDITFKKIYEVYPFENHMICFKTKGKYLNDWIENEASYYYMDYDIDSNYDAPFDDEVIYNVTTIDYVYDSTYFTDFFLEYEIISISNKITPRDYLIDDLINRGNQSFNINGEIKVTVKGFGELE